VTLKKGLTLNLPSGTWYVRGSGTLFVDARVTGAGSFQTGTGSGNTYLVLRNDANTFTGSLGGDTGRLLFTSIANKNVPSAAGYSAISTPITYDQLHRQPHPVNRPAFPVQQRSSRLVNDSACGSLICSASCARRPGSAQRP
jgi:hypothetical protein